MWKKKSRDFGSLRVYRRIDRQKPVNGGGRGGVGVGGKKKEKKGNRETIEWLSKESFERDMRVQRAVARYNGLSTRMCAGEKKIKKIK